MGKKLVRVENPLTYRGIERDDLSSLNPDPIALQTMDQVLDMPTAKLVGAGDANGDGKPDAFVVSEDGTNMRVFLSGQTGDLVFSPSPRSYDIGRGYFVGVSVGIAKRTYC